MINNENYEAYFLDYIEGNLSQKDIDMLLVFLDKNPNLKDELELYSEVNLTAPNINYDKSTLKQVDLINDIITSQNLEYFAIASIEDDLNTQKQKELTGFINSNPIYINEIDLISKTKLIAEKTIVYKEKGELKKSVPFIIPYYRIAGIAAILLLMIYFFIPKNDTNPDYIAIVNDSNITNTNPEESSVIDNKENIEQHSKVIPIEKNIAEFSKKSYSNKSINNVNEQKEQILIDKIKPIDTKNIDLNSNFKMNRQLAGSLPISNIKPYYESEDINQIEDDSFLTPKEFLTSIFKKKVLKSDNENPELEAEDFSNTLASATNDKISISKSSNNARYISINTKNFSFEKKISN